MGTSAVLASAMGLRILKTRKAMPAGGVLGLALIASAYNAQKSLQWRNGV